MPSRQPPLVPGGHYVFWALVALLILALAIFFVVLSGTNASAQEAQPKYRMYDGDTIYVDEEPVRILGIDTPEIKQNANCEVEDKLGYAARGRGDELIETRPVRIDYKLKADGTKVRDKFRRFLADVYVGGVSYAKILIDEGFGIEYDGRSRRVYYLEKLCFKKKSRRPLEGFLLD